jgi:GDP-4-dehydro-6-deoxy-D-mannose reductase
MKKILVTGATGMIGAHFVKACKAEGWDVLGIARSSAASRLSGETNDKVIRCDITDRSSLGTIFKRHRFDGVAHFAAQAFNSASWDQEWYTHQVNTMGTMNLLNCVRDYSSDATVLLACSSAEYGLATLNEGPLKEDRPLRPVSPYGVSKLATEAIGYQYFANYGMKVFLPRLFIHVGTGHPPATAIQNFARQLALIKKGKQAPVMNVGTLMTARDFIDVRDGVAGLMLLQKSTMYGMPVNIATGQAHSIRFVLDTLIDISGLSVEVRQAEGLLRPSDEEVLLGDNSRLRSLGWEPQYDLRETLREVFDDWMTRV